MHAHTTGRPCSPVHQREVLAEQGPLGTFKKSEGISHFGCGIFGLIKDFRYWTSKNDTILVMVGGKGNPDILLGRLEVGLALMKNQYAASSNV